MHHARIASSPRLQRLLKALRQAEGELSTLELIKRAQVVAVSAAISELRANGCEISCRCAAEEGGRRYYYQLRKGPS
ncbi:MAG: helix-turn-helix domain-containing protein [Shimia sp.]